MAYPKIDPMIRFYLKVEKEPGDGCWVWTGGISGGYPMFGLGPTTVRATRWIYAQEVGPIPEGLTLDHLCRNTRCVRVIHLEAVTIQENIRRAYEANRKPVCPKGHEFTPENTQLDRRGYRTCRTCNRERCRRNYLARKSLSR